MRTGWIVIDAEGTINSHHERDSRSFHAGDELGYRETGFDVASYRVEDYHQPLDAPVLLDSHQRRYYVLVAGSLVLLGEDVVSLYLTDNGQAVDKVLAVLALLFGSRVFFFFHCVPPDILFPSYYARFRNRLYIIIIPHFRSDVNITPAQNAFMNCSYWEMSKSESFFFPPDFSMSFSIQLVRAAK